MDFKDFVFSSVHACEYFIEKNVDFKDVDMIILGVNFAIGIPIIIESSIALFNIVGGAKDPQIPLYNTLPIYNVHQTF